MAVYPPRPAPFDCVICGNTRPLKWAIRDQMDYPPLCWPCEQYGWRQGAFTRSPDRRLAKQIIVLAEAIASEANNQTHRAPHGRA